MISNGKSRLPADERENSVDSWSDYRKGYQSGYEASLRHQMFCDDRPMADSLYTTLILFGLFMGFLIGLCF